MDRFWKNVVVLVVCCLAPCVSFAERGCTLPVTFEGFRAHAFAHSPLIAEIDREYFLELAKAIDTELLPNPELSIDQTYTRALGNGDNDPQTTASIAQPFKLSHLGKRDRVASLFRKVGDVKKQAKLLEFSQKLLLQFTALFTLQETHRFLGQAEELSAERVSALSKGVKEGLFSQGAESLFQGERYRIQAQREGVAASIASLQSELGSLLGTSCSVIAQAPPPLPELPSGEALAKRASASSISESSRTELMLALTTEQSRLAELDAVPLISPRFVYNHTNDGFDYFGAGLTIPFPVWNRNQAETTRADTERQVARSRNQFLQNGGIDFMVESLRRAAASSQKQATLYHSKVIPSFERALAGEERLYREGKGSVLDVWQTFRAVNDARVMEMTLRLQAVTARTQLSVVVGEEV
jgi:outer membrane protein TolC